MFERFTDSARRVLVVAQEEARRLGHNYIGTEHLLLGLVGNLEFLSEKILSGFGVTADAVRVGVEALVPPGERGSGSPPFTPRAKKVLELSLREALVLGHNYIGTEHMLLGVLCEGEGIAAQVLQGMGVDLAGVRSAVVAAVDESVGQAGGSHGAAQASAEVQGRSAADYARAFELLAEMLAESGVDLAEVDPGSIRIQGTSHGPGLGLRIAGGSAYGRPGLAGPSAKTAAPPPEEEAAGPPPE